MLLNSLFIASALLGTITTAWNKDIHQQIAHSAETLLSSTTKSTSYHILEPRYHKSIGLAAAWADDYAHTPQGAFSYQWHWIDSADNAPYYCNLYYHRDCSEGGCVVSAIANQTQILKQCIERVKKGELRSGSDIQCSEALKWVIHFIGDIAQPLHASGRKAGGNGIEVVFNNQTTELHAVWDGYIPYLDANVTSFPNTTLAPFFKHLLSRIEANNFSTPTSSWISCTDSSKALDCALAWACDSNALNCDYVYSQNIEGVDLATSGYATGAFEIVETQMSKAILRLGSWLNGLVDGEDDQRQGVVVQTDPNSLLGSDRRD